MYSGTFKGKGCAKCPVNQWACDAQYRGSRCEVLRAKAGVDFDPDLKKDKDDPDTDNSVV